MVSFCLSDRLSVCLNTLFIPFLSTKNNEIFMVDWPRPSGNKVLISDNGMTPDLRNMTICHYLYKYIYKCCGFTALHMKTAEFDHVTSVDT